MTPNAALRSAIFVAGLTQRAAALKARIPEARLSSIIHGRVVATSREQRRLAAALGQPIDQLFPQPEAVA